MRIVHQPPAPKAPPPPAPVAPAADHPPSKDEHTKAAHPVGSKIKERMERWGNVATPSFNEREHRLSEEHEREVHPASDPVVVEIAQESEHAQEPEPTPTSLKDRIAAFREQSAPDAFEKKRQAANKPEPEPEPEPEVVEKEEIPQKVHPVSDTIKARMEQWGSIATPSFNERELRLSEEQEHKVHPDSVAGPEEPVPMTEPPKEVHRVSDAFKERMEHWGGTASPSLEKEAVQQPQEAKPEQTAPPTPASLKDRIALLHDPKPQSPRSLGKPVDMPELATNSLKNLMATFGQSSPMPELGAADASSGDVPKAPVEEVETLTESPKPAGTPKSYKKPADMPEVGNLLKERMAAFGQSKPLPGAEDAKGDEAKATPVASETVELPKPTGTPKAYEKPADMPRLKVAFKDRLASFGDPGPANEVGGDVAEVSSPKVERKAYQKPPDLPTGVSLKNLMSKYTEVASPVAKSGDETGPPPPVKMPFETAAVNDEAPPTPVEKAAKPVGVKESLPVEMGDKEPTAGTPKACERPSDLPTGVSLKNLMAAYSDKAKPVAKSADEAGPTSPVKSPFQTAGVNAPHTPVEKAAKSVGVPEPPVQAKVEAPDVGTPTAYKRPSDMPTGVSLKNLLSAYTDKAKLAGDEKVEVEPAAEEPPVKADDKDPTVGTPKAYERPPDMPTGVSLKKIMAAYTDKAKPAADNVDKDEPEKAPKVSSKKEEWVQQANTPEAGPVGIESSPKAQSKGYGRPADMPTGVSLKGLMAAYQNQAQPAAQ